MRVVNPQATQLRLGQKLTELRLARNWTRRELAVRSGVAYATLCKLEQTGQGSMRSFVQALEGLAALDLLDAVVAATGATRATGTEAHTRVRRRASRASAKNNRMHAAQPTEVVVDTISARDREAALFARCAQVARGVAAHARDPREANAFRLAALLIGSAHPVPAARLMQTSALYFAEQPHVLLSPVEVVRKGWVISLPRLRDMLSRELADHTPTATT